MVCSAWVLNLYVTGPLMMLPMLVMHDIYEVNIAEILAVTTLCLADTLTKYTLPSPVHKAACG